MKHNIDFEIGLRVFADPLARTELERIENGEMRWQTVGSVDNRLLVLVVHTSGVSKPDDPFEVVRIISVRKPNRRERRQYEREIG